MKLRLAIPAIVVGITLVTAQPARAVVTIEYLATATIVALSLEHELGISVGDTGMGQFQYDDSLVPTRTDDGLIAILIGNLQATLTMNGIDFTSEGDFTLTLTSATNDIMEIRFEGIQIQGFDSPNDGITYRFTALAGSMLDDTFSLPDPSIFLNRNILQSAQVEVVLGESRFVGDLTITSVVPEPATAGLALLGLMGLACRRNRGRKPC